MTRDEQLIRAALEMAAEACADYPRVAPDESEWTHYDEQIAHSQACVRAIDPAEVLAKVGDERCAKCHHPRSNHPYRHPFVSMGDTQ